MAAECLARDGSKITDGKKATLHLAYDSEIVVVTGVVHVFEHVERVYDDEGIAVGKTSEVRWEISTDDPQHPAIGFLPQNVLTKV